MYANTRLRGSVLVIALLLLGIVVRAQNPGASSGTVTQNLNLKVDGSALLAIYNTNANAGNSTAISMSLTGASEAGATVYSEATNSDTRMRISSLVENGKTRNITASISPNLNNTGTELYVNLTKPTNFQPSSNNGGTSAGDINLTDGSNKTLVSGITTCWSGTATYDGYTVTYRYLPVAGTTYLISRSVVVTYTITAEM